MLTPSPRTMCATGRPKKVKKTIGSARFVTLKAGTRQRIRSSLRVWARSILIRARPARSSRAPRHAEERFLESRAGHLEIAHDHAALEEPTKDRFGLVAQEMHATIANLEALYRQPAEGRLAESHLGAEVDALARYSHLYIAGRRVCDDY